MKIKNKSIVHFFLYFFHLFLSSYASNLEFPFHSNSLKFSKSQIRYNLHVVSEIEKITLFFQDSFGYIWIGTNSGLYRYNSETYEPNSAWALREPEHSLLNPYINCIAEDEDRNIWIGTNNGLSRKDLWSTNYEKHYLYDGNDSNTISNSKITCLKLHLDGSLWIGTSNGLNRLDLSTDRNQRFLTSPSEHEILDYHIVDFCFDDHGFIWVVTQNNGVLILDPEDGSIIRLKDRISVQSPQTLVRFSYIVNSNSGMIWIGTHKNGLIKIDPITFQWNSYTNSQSEIYSLLKTDIYTLMEDTHGILWIGTSAGLYRFDPIRESFVVDLFQADNTFSLSSNAIISIFQDRQGAIWIGTNDGVINRYDPNQLFFPLFTNNPSDQNSLSANKVNAMCIDGQGNIWVGTQDGVLNRMDETEKNFDRFPLSFDNTNVTGYNPVTALYPDPDGSIWVGTLSSGLLNFNPANEKVIPLPFVERSDLNHDGHYLHDKSVRCILVDQEGLVWVGTEYSGIAVYSKDTKEFIIHRHDPLDLATLSSSSINVIFQDKSGMVWIGTNGKGLNRYDSSSNRFERIPTSPQQILISAAQIEMYKDYPEVDRINEYLRNPIRESDMQPDYSEKNSESPPLDVLKGSIVNDIFEDQQGRLWVATNEALNRIEPVTGLSIPLSDSFNSFSYNFQSIEEDENGDLWISTNTGILRLKSDLQNYNVYDRAETIQHIYISNA